MAFSATDSAFEGFRLARRSPLTILIWALFYIAMVAATLALIGGNLGALMEMMQDMESSGGMSSQEDALEFMTAYFSMMGAVYPISLILSAVITAAVHRAVLRPSESAFGYLRLGMDEVRVLVVTFVLALLLTIGCSLVIGIGAVAVGVAASAMGDYGWVAGAVGVLAAIALVAWVLVRFSLAVPITVAERRFAIFDSWSLTRGRFWGLFGMALLAFVLTILVQTLASLVILPVMYFTTDGFQALSGLEGMQPIEIFQTMAPFAIIGLIFYGLLGALQLAILYAPFASAYQGLTGADTGRGDAPDGLLDA